MAEGVVERLEMIDVGTCSDKCSPLPLDSAIGVVSDASKLAVGERCQRIGQAFGTDGLADGRAAG